MSLQDKASIIWPKGAPYKAGNLAAWNPQGQSLVEFSVVRATQKWRINEAGTWEALAANVIARDFTNGGCGDYTIEPARTNLFLNSTTGATQTITVVISSVYSVSFSGTGSITFSGGATGTLNGTGATALDRVSTTITPSTTSVTCTISGTVEYVNFELGAYATSWIETAGSIVTRNRDIPSLSAASALLNSIAGGYFIEAAWFDSSSTSAFALSDGTNTNRVNLYSTANTVGFDRIGTTPSVSNTGGTLSNNTFTKLACRYALDDVAVYQDGSSIITSSINGIYAANTLTDVQFNLGNGSSLPFYGRLRQFIVFNQAPTNTQLGLISTP